MHKRQSGFGLIEVLLSLMIIAALLVVGINYYSNVSRTQKIGRLVNQMNGIGQAITSYIHKHHGEDVSSALGGGTTDVASSTTLNIPPLDVKNIWSPGSSYKVTVTPNSNGCTSIQLTVPKGMRAADCARFIEKFKSSFKNAAATCGKSVQVFTYCAD